MTTKKELVEAHAFNRRRLVSAFVSGAAAAHEGEPAGSGRLLVGGAALALLLLTGTAITGVIQPTTSADWDKAGLVISRQTGGRYLLTQHGAPLRPVINLTSAQLVLGAQVTPRIVSQSALAGRRVGDDIGIVGAPPQLPPASSFVESGWTACTANGAGVSVVIARRPAVSTAPGVGVVATADGRAFWVVAEGTDHRARRYRVATSAGADNLLEAVGLPPQSQALRVSQAWLALFPAGGVLGRASFGLGAPVGSPLPYAGAPGISPAARVGDVASVSSIGSFFLLTAAGPAPLDPFAAAIYTTSAALARHGPREAGTGRLPQVRQVAPTWSAAAWPTDALHPASTTAGGAVCAQLEVRAGSAPAVLLATAPRGRAWTVPAVGVRDQRVDPGAGALVRSGEWGQTTSSRAWIVDERGHANPVVDEQTLTTLGFASCRAPLVPEAWIDVLGRGVALSRALALRTPGEAAKPGP